HQIACRLLFRAARVLADTVVVQARHATAGSRLAIADPDAALAAHGQGRVPAHRAHAAVHRAFETVVAVRVLLATHTESWGHAFVAHRGTQRTSGVLPRLRSVVDARHARCRAVRPVAVACRTWR